MLVRNLKKHSIKNLKFYNLNKKFGEYISEVADYVILVGRKQTRPILDGLNDKKYKKRT